VRQLKTARRPRPGWPNRFRSGKLISGRAQPDICRFMGLPGTKLGAMPGDQALRAKIRIGQRWLLAED
jgi:hypothetical protein